MEKMDAIYERVCGLDVHKKSVVACRRRLTSSGRVEKEVATFGTTTSQLLALLAWLQEWDVTHVAMESTGVYWKPVWNMLEGHVELLLVNARHLKTVPGRKTDVKDCGVDCAADAVWVAAGQFCALSRSPSVARPHASSHEADRSTHLGGEPDTQSA